MFIGFREDKEAWCGWSVCVIGEIQGRQAEGEGKQVTRGPVHLAESDRRRLGEP